MSPRTPRLPSFPLLPAPWALGLRARLLLATLFFREGRYGLDQIVQSIIDSNRVRKSELAAAQLLAERDGVLAFAVEAMRGTEGVIAEFGVFRGTSLRLLARAAPERPVIGFDSFQGLPADWGALLPKGEFACPTPSFVENNISLRVGAFSETLPVFAAEGQPVALAHIDCDLHDSTVTVLNGIAPLLVPGSVVVFDEYYGYPGFADFEYRAWKEFVARRQLTPAPIAVSSHSCAFRL